MTTEQQIHLDRLSDHDLMILTAQKVIALEHHAAEINGTVRGLSERQLRAEGALAFGKWAFAAIFIMMGAGIGLAGLVLTLVVQQGG